MDLSTIPEEVLLARGQYATVRAGHEDAKKELSVQCGQMQAYVGQILRKLQPSDGEVTEGVDGIIYDARRTLSAMETVADDIVNLAKQRAELRRKAWGR